MSNFNFPQANLLSGVNSISESINHGSPNVSITEPPGVLVTNVPPKTADEVVAAIQQKLNNYSGNGGINEEDFLFMEYGDFLRSKLHEGDLREVYMTWESRISPLVENRCQELRKRIHIGSPLYNTALAYFICGNFDSALCYFIAADNEDMQNKNAPGVMVTIGKHPLSSQVIVQPLIQEFASKWSAPYREVTGCQFDQAEITSLLEWLARFTSDSVADSVQVVIALHRLRHSLNVSTSENQATCHLRVRAIADMLIVVESNLKRQAGRTTKMLGGLIDGMLTGKTAQVAYDRLNRDFDSQFTPRTPPRQTPQATDWLVAESVRRITNASIRDERIGLVCFLAQHLRNGLLHSIEPSLQISLHAALAVEVAGLIFCMLRITKLGAENKL
jgi:hypothetical protein